MANKRSADPATRVEEILAQFSVRTPPVPVDRFAIKGPGAQLRFSPLDEELSGTIYVSGTPSSLGSIRYTIRIGNDFLSPTKSPTSFYIRSYFLGMYTSTRRSGCNSRL